MGLTTSRPQSHYEKTVYFLLFGPQDFLALISPILERWKAELTLEPPNGFETRTPGLGIKHLNHQANALLDLPISFLYMSKHCSIFVIYNQSNRFIFCTIHFSFTQLYQMLLLFSNNYAKQKPISKQQLRLLDTFSTKKSSQLTSFNAFTFTLYSNVWPFIFNVMLFM